MSLAQQVGTLACNRLRLLGLAGEMLATIQLNYERGHLVAPTEEGKQGMARLLASWSKEYKQLEEEAKA